MKIIVTTFYYPNFKPMAMKTIPNHMEYCSKNGYDYKPYAVEEEVLGDGYQRLCEAGKKNAELVLYTAKENKEFDYIFTLGCDAIITDMKFNLETLIETSPYFEILIGTDKAGKSTSQMLIRNSKTSFVYFGKVMEFIRQGGEHDQRYFIENPKPFIIETPQRTMNAYDCEARGEGLDDPGNWTEGDFLVHLAGLTLEQRMAVIPKWLGRVNRG